MSIYCKMWILYYCKLSSYAQLFGYRHVCTAVVAIFGRWRSSSRRRFQQRVPGQTSFNPVVRSGRTTAPGKRLQMAALPLASGTTRAPHQPSQHSSRSSKQVSLQLCRHPKLQTKLADGQTICRSVRLASRLIDCRQRPSDCCYQLLRLIVGHRSCEDHISSEACRSVLV